MLEYLDIQKKVLKPDASSYTVALQDQNKKVFIYFSKIRGLDPKFKNDVKKCAAAIKSLQIDSKKLSVRNATLNSLEQAKAINAAFGHHADDGLEATSHLNSKSQNNLANKLNKPSEILAAILHLSMTTDSVEAEKALTNDKLRSIPTDRLLKATSWLASSGIMPKGRLKASDADSLVGILLGKL
jgi:hypothetical protein